MARSFVAIAPLICTICAALATAAEKTADGMSGSPSEPIGWETSYATAMAVAERGQKPLVLVFHRPADASLIQAIESAAKTDPALRRRLDQVVLARLPLDARISLQGTPTELVNHPAYAGVNRSPGFAVVDLRSPESPEFGRVIEAVPLSQDDARMPEQIAAVLRGVTTAQSTPLVWHANYSEATEEARSESKMLLLYLYDPSRQEWCRRFEELTLVDPNVVARLERFVLAKLPTDACIDAGEQQLQLIRHPAFREMQCQPGIAVVDYVHRDAEFYGTVVSTFPFLGGRTYSPYEMSVILDLPPGTLTQRTMIYAVRVHPERPASTDGQLDPHLADEAESHSQHQANIRVQGHHNWNSRFHHINTMLPSGLLASEVCAESWPGEGLLQAAIECVRCWRSSSGHWSRVRAPQQMFGYDIKRGSNGIWYATGIFGGYR